MSLISDFESVIEGRLKTILQENGYPEDVAQVIRPKRQPDWQPRDRTLLVKAHDAQPSPEDDRAGNPPAIGRRLPVEITALVIPSKHDERSFDEIATDFAEEAHKAIVTPADWETFDDKSVNAMIEPIRFSESDGEEPASAKFFVQIIYRISETNPSELRG